jgi:hypothetical protein
VHYQCAAIINENLQLNEDSTPFTSEVRAVRTVITITGMTMDKIKKCLQDRIPLTTDSSREELMAYRYVLYQEHNRLDAKRASHENEERKPTLRAQEGMPYTPRYPSIP